MRLLLTLDADLCDREVLEATARLAAALEADLHGLFIEDADVFRMAELPGAWEMSYPKAAERRIQLEDLESAYRRRAAEARESLFAIAQAAQVRCSFEVMRGRRSHCLLSAAPEPDVVVLTSGRSARLFGSTTRRSADVRPRPGSVMAVFDGSEAGRQAVSIGRQVASRLRAPFYVAFAVDPSIENRRPLRKQLAEQVGQLAVVDTPGTSVGDLAAAANDRHAALILWSGGDSDQGERLARMARCSVALLRKEEPEARE